MYYLSIFLLYHLSLILLLLFRLILRAIWNVKIFSALAVQLFCILLDKCHSEYRHQCHGFRRLKCELFFFYRSQITAMGSIVLQFLPYIALFPILVFTFHRSLGDLCTPLSLHIFQLLLIAYSGAAMHSLLTHAQSVYSCTVCLLMHSMLTYAQPSYTVYKEVMDTHFQ